MTRSISATKPAHDSRERETDLALPSAAEGDWIPFSRAQADAVVEAWTHGKIGALLRERGLDDEVETTRRFVIETIPEYADRFLLELLQNAHDALPAVGGGRIRIELDLDAEPHGELLVGNSGTPFRLRDFRSLCRMAQSEKPPGQGIGHKGVGFKSVLQVAPQPEVYSAASGGAVDAFDGFCFTFPDEARYRELFAGAGDDVPQMTPYSLPVTIPIARQSASVRRLASEGFSTVIRLPLGPHAALTSRRAVEDVLSSAAPVLLFLHRIELLDVRVHEGGQAEEHRLTRTTTPVTTTPRARVEQVDLAEAGRFLLATGAADEATFRSAIAEDVDSRRASDRWLEWTGAPEVSIAVPLGPMTDDRLYCYLPMHESASSPVAGHLNAPFAIGLARKELIPDSRINNVLLDEAADICVEAALGLKAHEAFRSNVVEFVAWPREGVRVVDAVRRRGEDPRAIEVLPVLRDRGWASFEGSSRWSPDDTTELTPEAVTSVVGDPIVDPAIGPERLDAVVGFGSEVLELDLMPTADRLANWAEAVARQLHRRERAKGPPAAAWVDFYDDLSRVFPGATGRALEGRRIILGEDKELLETWSDSEPPGKRRKVRRGVFFARTALDDPEADATEDNFVPRSLRRSLARVHPDIDWFVPGEAGRRNRPGRVFLEQQDLVRIPRIPDLLRLVERVAKGTRSPAVWRDALVFVYRITRPGPRRPDLGTLGLDRIGLRVPAVGGWVPSQRGLFSRGWTILGGQMSDLVASGAPVSADIAGLGQRLLEPAEAWIPKRTAIEGWVELLGYCGVRDGLRPISTSTSTALLANPGWWWQDPGRIAERYNVNESDRVKWEAALEFGTWPHHSGAEYVAVGSPARIPGQSDFDRFPETARLAFAHLVLAGLNTWADSVLWFQVHRRVGEGDPMRMPSPAHAFLVDAPWLRASRPGSGGEVDWVAPGDVWLIGADDTEPFYAPVLDRRFRGDVADSAWAQGRLVELGAHFWSERADAVAKLLLLGRLLHDGQVLPGLIAQVRNAITEAWKAIADGDPSPPLDGLADGYLVIARRDQLDTRPGSSTEPYFVRGSPDRMLELVLASIGEPVLVAGGDVGQKVWTQLQASGSSGARLIWPSDLVIEVDGEPASALLENAEPLIAGDRTWLSDLVALTLELKPSEFRPPSQKVIQGALQRISEIRLLAGQDLALRLDGQRREVPTYSRRVVPTFIEGQPVIAWVPDEEAITWRGLRRLAPAIAELIQERGARDALENVVQALGEGAAMVEEPSDEQFAEVFGVPVGRISELRHSHRGIASQALYRLVPLVAAIVNVQAAVSMRTQAMQNPSSEQGLADALEPLRDQLPPELTVEVLLEAAWGSSRIAEARQKLGIDFGAMNRVLLQLRPDYDAETHAELHSTVMSTYLARERDRIVDALRVLALEEGLETDGTLQRYGDAVAALDAAAKAARLPADDDLLAPDPAWLVEYQEPPERLVADRAIAWLQSHGARAAGVSSGRAAASTLRASNGRLLSGLLPRMALVVGAWIDRHGVAAAPDWVSDTTRLVQSLAVSGALDFEPIDETSLITLLAGRHAWPVEMEPTIDLARLHLTEADLLARQTEDDRRRSVTERARRGVEVVGRVVTLDPDTLAQSVDHILSTVAQASLAVSAHEVQLGPPPATRKGGGAAGAGRARGRGGRVPKEKLETIGLIGEIIAWVWLRHHYGEHNVLWRSENRAFVIQDGDPGDDSLGYDFEVLHGRSRLFYEIKASTADPREFELSEAEVRFALSKANSATYRVLYIGNVGDAAEQVILPLPNPLAARTRDRYRALESGIKYAFAAIDG